MWHTAYLEQAQSDWDAYKALQGANVPNCHPLHYLQRSTEKLGNAFFLAGGTPFDTVKRSHQAFTRFLQLAARNHGLQGELGMTRLQLQRHIHHPLRCPLLTRLNGLPLL
ncbi:hypothetical protein HYR99_14655 [Candidatus Poribacteria bacterium]|nr:hypothetical protein [Candidatus Poribacteria bacterium]